MCHYGFNDKRSDSRAFKKMDQRVNDVEYFRVRNRAQFIVQGALYKGTIKKPSNCSNCGKKLPSLLIHGHHEDYDNPLDVIWLCHFCHYRRHREMKAIGEAFKKKQNPQRYDTLIKIDLFRCQKCRYEWTTRLIDRKPKACPNCHSRKWDNSQKGDKHGSRQERKQIQGGPCAGDSRLGRKTLSKL